MPSSLYPAKKLIDLASNDAPRTMTITIDTLVVLEGLELIIAKIVQRS